MRVVQLVLSLGKLSTVVDITQAQSRDEIPAVGPLQNLLSSEFSATFIAAHASN